MIYKKGTVVLRDVVFMMMMVSCIFVLASFFVSDMATNYDNDDMLNEWSATGINVSGNSMFVETGDEVATVGVDLSAKETGVWKMITSVANSLEGMGDAIIMVVAAPNTIGSLVSAILIDANTPEVVANVIKYLIVVVFWIIIVFTIISAFLRGGKL